MLRPPLRPAVFLSVVALSTLSLAACKSDGSSASSSTDTSSASSGTTSSTSPSAAPSDQTTPSAAPTSDASGSDSGTGNAAGVPNPCRLMTADEAKQALGVSSVKTIHSAVDVADTCSYRSGDKVATVIVRKVSQSLFDESGQKTKGVKPVTDLGADAFVDDDIVQFWKSGVQVAIGISAGYANSLPAEKAAAKVAISRL